MKKEYSLMRITNKFGGKFVKIALLFIAVFAFFDTHLFVYPSLSYSLLPEVFIALSILTVGILTFHKKPHYNQMAFAFCFVWIAYILILHHILEDSDDYRVWYLISSILYAMTIAICLSTKLFTWNQVENALLLLLFINVCCVYLQFFGWINSSNPFFTITGLYENPSSTAIYLTSTCVILAERILAFHHRKYYIVVLVASIGAIALLQCRTAWLGLAVILTIYIIRWIKSRHLTRSRYYLCIFCLFALFGDATLGAFYLKYDSSQGRMLIWKNTLELVEQNPKGYGYGLFEKTYNLQQSAYFQQGHGNNTESNVASFVAMPYNDYLESTVEGGFMGFAFYIGLFALILRRAYIQKQRKIFLVCLSLGFMATMNFVYTSVGVWLLLMSFFGYLMSAKVPSQLQPRLTSHKCSCIILGALGLSLAIHTVTMTSAQIQLTPLCHFVQKGISVENEQLESLRNDIGTSEAFYTTMGRNYLLSKDYPPAILSLKRASKYSSSPSIYYLLWQAYMGNGEYQKAIQAMATWEYMQPNLLRPKYCLLETYSMLHDRVHAMQYANKIIKTKIKIPGKEADSIKRAAQLYKLNYKN